MSAPRILLLLLCLGLIGFGLFRLVRIEGPDRPTGTWEQISELKNRDDLNLVFILVDTLRADRLSTYGYERETSPILTALANSGVRFADTRAQSTWTKTSMASLLTSTYPATNRITRFTHGLPEAVETPAETMKAAGFRTIGVWRNGWVAPNFGFHQGFDLYLNPKTARDPAVRLLQNNPSAHKLPGTDHDVTWTAAEFVRTVRDDERFFLYLHYMDLHQYVYDESADFGPSYSDIYDNSIRWTDGNIGTLVAVLQQEKLMRRTVIALASDHGEAFDEHGIEGHARNLHIETTNVPFVLLLPFRLEEPVVVQSPVENVDIFPTLYDLMGLPEMPNAQGRSLVPHIEAAAKGEAEPEARLRYAQLDRTWGLKDQAPLPMVTVDDGQHRLFQHFRAETTGENGAGQTVYRPSRTDLYDIVEDPGEHQNIAPDNPELVDRFAKLLVEYIHSPEAEWGRPKLVPLSDMELGHLRALGYVIDADGEIAGEGGDAEAAPDAGGDAAPE